ncbi:hypothetical protein ACP4OV_018269 [Aristida adscensionis]
MGRMGASIVLVILALDIAAGMLAFKAQAADNKAEKVVIFFIRYREPDHHAYQLGLAGAGLLLLAHAISTCFILGGFSWLYYYPGPQVAPLWASFSRAFAATSWIIFVVAMSLLLLAAEASTKTWRFVHINAAALGGYLCFIHGLVIVLHHVTATAASARA